MSSGENVALNKSASQSSTLKTNSAFAAVDGDVTTFSHTNTGEYSPWWLVDLENSYSTEFVNIKNRYCGADPNDPHDCLCRLSNAKITAFDAQGAVVMTKTFGNTCGVHELSFDLSTCTSTPSESTTAIAISNVIVSEDDSFSVTFSNPMAQTQIYAAVIANSACTGENSSFEVNSSTQNAASGSSSVTISHSINELITTEAKNSGSLKLEFCLRADVRHSQFPSSIVASKVTVGITITFETNNSFQVNMQANDFSATYAGYLSERGVDLSAMLGECTFPGNDGPYAIGSTLKFCIQSTDPDVVISGLNDVSFTDTAGNPILEIIDTNGQPSFVTSISGLHTKSTDVSTMMASTIYDQGYGGTTINVYGTISVEYMNTGRRRQLQDMDSESKPFALAIQIADDESNAFGSSLHSVSASRHCGAKRTTVVFALLAFLLK